MEGHLLFSQFCTLETWVQSQVQEDECVGPSADVGHPGRRAAQNPQVAKPIVLTTATLSGLFKLTGPCENSSASQLVQRICKTSVRNRVRRRRAQTRGVFNTERT